MTQSFPVCGKKVICLPNRTLRNKSLEYFVGIYTHSQIQDNVIEGHGRKTNKKVNSVVCVHYMCPVIVIMNMASFSHTLVEITFPKPL